MIQFLLLPGLGSDGRIGYAERSLPYNVITPDYILPLRREKLPAYSKRLLDILIHRKIIDPNAPIVLAGISMGGAMAQEMSQHIKARAIVLLGSPRTGDELRPFITGYIRFLSPFVPLWVHRWITVLLPTVMKRSSNISDEDILLCQTMYRELPKKTFWRGLRILSNWKGCPITIPTFRIHGEMDHIIPYDRTDGADLVVPGAKHLVSISHAEIVNHAIEEFLKPLL